MLTHKWQYNNSKMCADTNIEQKNNIWLKNMNFYFSLLEGFLSGGFCLGALSGGDFVWGGGGGGGGGFCPRPMYSAI